MNIIGRMFNAIKWGSAPPRDPVIASWFGGVDDATGVTVTSDVAMKTSAVFACVRLIAETMATMPLLVYKNLPDGGKERDRAHPLYNVLRRRPNRRTTSFQWIERVIWDMCLRGNHYALIVTSGRNPVEEIIPLNPDKVIVLRDEQGKVWHDFVRKPGDVLRFSESEILHIPLFPVDDSLKGQSIISYAAQTIGATIAAEKHGSRFFKNGATPIGAVVMPGRFKERESAKQFIKDFSAAITGDNAHKVTLLEDGLEYKPYTINNKDSQFLELRQFNVPDIARVFRVQPHKIADLSRATFSNIEHQGLEFVQDTILPWAVRIEQAIERSLFLDAWRETHFVQFLLDGLLRGDMQTRYAAYAIGRNWGWLSINDVRRKENENPLPPEIGDVYLTPLNMQEAGAKTEAVTTPQPKPKPTNQAQALALTLLAENARRMASKETKAVERIRSKPGGDSCEKQIAEFSESHAKHIAESIAVPVKNVVQFLLENPIGTISAEQRTADLILLAKEYHDETLV